MFGVRHPEFNESIHEPRHSEWHEKLAMAWHLNAQTKPWLHESETASNQDENRDRGSGASHSLASLLAYGQMEALQRTDPCQCFPSYLL